MAALDVYGGSPDYAWALSLCENGYGEYKSEEDYGYHLVDEGIFGNVEGMGTLGNYIDYADASGHESGEWNAGLQLSMNLFTGGAIRGGVVRADAASRGATELVRLAELQVGQDLDRARAAVAESHARVRSLEKAAASLAEVARIERLTLQTGSGTQTDYLRAEADLLTARANRVEARHREIAARVELARVTGVLDVAWLARNLGAQE